MLARWRDGDGVIGGYDSGDLISTRLYGVITFTGVANEWLQIFSAGGAAPGNLGVASAPFTFIALVRPDRAGAAWAGIFQNGNGPGAGGNGFWIGIDGSNNRTAINIGSGYVDSSANATPVFASNQWQLVAVVVRSTSTQSFYIYNFDTTTWANLNTSVALTPTTPTGKAAIGCFLDSSGNEAGAERYKGDMAWMGVWPLDKSNGGTSTPADIQAFIDNGPWPYVFNSSFFMAFDTDDLLDEAG
jgi:hypothetical protein